MDLQNKAVVISGSTGELGQTVTRSFLEHGASVAGFASRDTTLQTLQSSLGPLADKFEGYVVNATDESSMMTAAKKIADRHGNIEVLINLVGGFHGGTSVAQTTAEQWDQMMAINAKSVFMCCRHILPLMSRQRGGRIVNIAGKGGLQAVAGMSAYSASKAAVINLTQTIAAEQKENNITANVVIPSIIDTQANRKAMPGAKYGNWVTAESVAQTILFVCSNAAKDISGAVIPVYGKS